MPGSPCSPGWCSTRCPGELPEFTGRKSAGSATARWRRPLTASPPFVLNVTGAGVLRVRDIAERFGKIFGIEPEFDGEEAALRRELLEEIGVDFPPEAVRYATRIDIDWNRPGFRMKTRAFFEVSLAAERVRSLILQEGADLRVFSPAEIQNLRITPYDAFGLWLHINRERIG